MAPPLGLLYIAAYLEAAGHEVVVHDFIFDLKAGSLTPNSSLYEECSDQIMADAPDLVGFSTQCSTSPGAVNIARRIKKSRPSIGILFGGHDVSFVATEYLNAFPFIDFVLAGEAELTTPRLVAAIGGNGELSQIPGLGYRQAGGIARLVPGEARILDLDTAFSPAYHLVPPLTAYFGFSREPVILIDSGRGCSFRCEFCQTSLLSGQGIRYRSVDSLVSELSSYNTQFGPFEAYFVHDLFTARRSYVEELCERLIAVDMPITWQCRCRLDQVDERLLSLMHRAGCRRLLYGVESGSESMLQRMNKRIRPRVIPQVIEKVQNTVDVGIFPSLSMVVGTPEETLEDLNATMRLASAFVKIGRVNAFIQLISPLPGTALAKRVAHRLTYRGETVPTAFSQGIEFLDGRRLPEDEAVVCAWPQIFQSFQTVIPDHGDLDICIDVSLAYCKLLEVYCYTFERLVARVGFTHLELFRQYRDFSATLRGESTLIGIKDSEIWASFNRFATEQVGMLDNDEDLLELLRYETVVQELALSVPVPTEVDNYLSWRCQAKPYRLRSAARVFRTSHPVPWNHFDEIWPKEKENERCFVIFMTRDRLKHMEVGKRLADALDILANLADLGTAGEAYYQKLVPVLDPLAQLGLFESIAKSV